MATTTTLEVPSVVPVKELEKKDTNQMTVDFNKFWDLGEEDIICPSQKSLYKIMNALILCGGKMHASHSQEAHEGKWEHPTRSCAVIFRISLPIDMKGKFEELSGFKLSDPPRVSVN